MNISIRISLLLVLFLAGCKSGKKALEQGNYYEAVMTAVERLRKSPNNKNAQEVLAEAYPRLVDYNLDRIRQLRNSNDPLRWEDILTYYDQLNKAYDEIKRSPAADQVISGLRLFTSEYEETRRKAAEVNYVLGENLMPAARRGDRGAAKEAYRRFTRAEELSPGFRNVENLALESRDLATLHVVINPIPMPSRHLDVSNEFFYNKLMEFLHGRQVSPFIEFYSNEEARALDLQPDQYIDMAFDDFVIGDAYIKETVQKRQQDSVVVGQVEVVEDGEKVKKDVYGTVRAEVHLFEKQLNSRALLDCRIIQASTETMLTQEKFSGSFTWIDYWGYYNGDERALTEEDKRRLRNRREVMPPPPQDLFVEVTAGIYDQVADYLSNFYRGY